MYYGGDRVGTNTYGIDDEKSISVIQISTAELWYSESKVGKM